MHTGRNWVVFSVSLDPPEIAFVWFLLATTGWPGEEFHSPDPGLLRTVPRLSQRGEGLSSRHKGRQTYANPSGEFQQAALKTTTRENKKTRKAKTTRTLPKKKHPSKINLFLGTGGKLRRLMVTAAGPQAQPHSQSSCGSWAHGQAHSTPSHRTQMGDQALSPCSHPKEQPLWVLCEALLCA